MDRLRRIAPPLALAAAFAVFVQMCVELAGRVPAGALTAALTAGALAVALLGAPRPVRALRGLTRRLALQACAGGLLAVAGAPALIAALRMTDAPAGSIVVFWVSGGWAAVAAAGAAVLALRERQVLQAGWSAAGALLAVAGVAGVVADWERPSSFSPLVRFAPQELGILFGGVLLLAGGLLLVRVARSSGTDGALLWAAAAGFAASLVWWAGSSAAYGWSSLTEHSVEVALAAVAWGLVCRLWPATLKAWGPATGAAALSVAPVLLSGLAILEQAVGVAGPQPLVVPGVIAGSLLVLAGACALVHARGAESASAARWPVLAAAVPAFLAAVGLLLPAIAVRVDVTVTGGAFAGSWNMAGAESVAGWAAVALAVLVIVAAADARPAWPVVAALAASAAWPWLTDVPTHVWNSALAPGIQQYYGTEYGSIGFTALPNAALAGAVILGVMAMLAIMAVRRMRGGRSHPDHGGS
jgi:hypothetical protein